MTYKILHCVLDEKFIDPLMGVLVNCENQCSHEYACVTRTKKDRYLFIKNSEKVDNVLEEEFLSYIERKSYNAVIVHGLSALTPKLIANIPQPTKVGWVAWGYDIYQPIFGHNSLIPVSHIYHKKTRIYRLHNLFFLLRNELHRCVIRYRNSNSFEDAIERFDYFSGIIPEEYQLIKDNKKNTFFKAKAALFSYADLTQPIKIDNLYQPFSTGNNILVGNSADDTNNHFDIIHLLSRFNLEGKKIIFPLSYAGKETYVMAVVSYGKKKLGDSFVPIKEYMKYAQYLELINSAGYSIYYIERQQALGNIVLSIWNGNMVFLSETSVMYPYFKNRGYYIFSIQHDLFRIEKNEFLTEEQKRKNRELLLDFCSLEAIIKRDEEYFNTILNS